MEGLSRGAEQESIGGESEEYCQPNRKEERKKTPRGLCVRWSWIATVVTQLLVLREHSIARLAANYVHISVKPNQRFSVYCPYVPFVPQVSVGVPVCGA